MKALSIYFYVKSTTQKMKRQVETQNLTDQ